MKIKNKLIQRNYLSTNGRVIKYIVIHTYGGKGTSLYRWFNRVEHDSTKRSSAHYAVMYDGKVERYVQDKDIAFHAGSAGINGKSIGIEHQDNGNPANKRRTEALYQASGKLVEELCNSYKLPIDKNTVVPHRKYAKGRTCPGGLDMDKIIKIAKAEREKRLAKKPIKQPELSTETKDTTEGGTQEIDTIQQDILDISKNEMENTESAKKAAIYIAGSQIGTLLSALLTQAMPELDPTVTTAGLIALANIVLFVVNKKFNIW